MLAVMIAASCLAATSTALAGNAKTPAAHASAAHQQMHHQQQLYQQEMKRQQDFARKQVQQQQQAYQQQIKAAQAMAKQVAQQQKATQHPPKAPQPHQHKASSDHQAVATRAATPSKTAAPAAGASTAHAGSSHPVGHGYRGYHRNNRSYRHHTRWPNNPVDPETAALIHLKTALDGVGQGANAIPKHSGAIATALKHVVEVDTPPTPVAVQQLAGHLTTGLSHRDAANADTQTMALALRGVMNSIVLPKNDLTAVMNEHHAALRSARFKPDDIAAIQASLKTIADQERSRR